MIELKYKGDKNKVYCLKIDRTNKRLWEAVDKEKEYIEIKWNRLFDKGKERIQDIITAKFPDEAFIKTLSYWFNARYKMILVEIKNGN